MNWNNFVLHGRGLFITHTSIAFLHNSVTHSFIYTYYVFIFMSRYPRDEMISSTTVLIIY